MNQEACNQYLASIRRLNTFLNTQRSNTMAETTKLEPFTFYLVRDTKVHHTTDAPIIAVRQGEIGYYPIHLHPNKVDFLNRAPLPAEVAESALTASMFGWECPAAQAANDWVSQHQPEGEAA